MAMENKRIIQLNTERTTPAADDYVMVDSATAGTAKYLLPKITDAIDQEISDRTSADTALQTAITNETTARANADTTLQGNITAEATARAEADTAINGEITQLKEDLSPFLTVGINLLDLNAITNGVYISNANGSEVAYASWSASDYIPIELETAYRVLYLSNNSYVHASGQNLYWAVYDKNKAFVRGGIGDGIYNPSGKYLRVSCPSSYFNDSIMVVTDTDASNITDASDYEAYQMTSQPFVDSFNVLNDDVDALKAEEQDVLIYKQSDLILTDGYVRYWTGEIDTSGYHVTDYLDVSDFQGMLLRCHTSIRANYNAGIAFYDTNKSYLQGVNADGFVASGADRTENIIVQVPKKAKYMRVSVGNPIYTLGTFGVYLDLSSMAKNIYKYNDLLVSDYQHWVNFNPAGTEMILSDAWKANAEQAYTNMQNYLKATNAYDFASLLIETDSHGRGTLPFNWMQKHDNSVRCAHLGDIVDDKYRLRELEYYYHNTKECKKLITLVGNHEVNYGGEQGNQYDLIRLLNSTKRKNADPVGCFSVVDNDQRIKYICLNPYKIITGGSECAITPTQMDWFLDELNSSEFDIVILSHNAINDNDLVDRDGNSGSAWIGGPYAVGYNVINRILKAFKLKGTDTIETSEYGTINVDFTKITVDLICNLAGHTHHELFKMDTYLTYVANWYGNTHCCVFFAADKVNKKVALFQFDNSTVYSTLEFNY